MSDFNFIEIDAQNVINQYIETLSRLWEKSRNEKLVLSDSDPMKIFVQACAYREIMLLNIINDTAKQNLLKYARDQNLDEFAYGRTTSRKGASKSKCIVRFNYSEPLYSSRAIPEQTKVTDGGTIYFQNVNSYNAAEGDTYTDVLMECTVEGAEGNGYMPGEINTLVDPLPFVQSVENITESSGGSDVESDDAYRERIHLAPEGFSTAGPELAYAYLAKEFDPSLQDIKVTTPSPGVVDVKIVKQDGAIPDNEYIDELKEYLSDKDRRPLTDYVNVSTPGLVNYDIDIVYYLDVNILSSQKANASIESAVRQYALWQKQRIGRNIDPSELTKLTKNAGASRISIVSPVFTEINEGDLAIASSIKITFGGFEDE